MGKGAGEGKEGRLGSCGLKVWERLWGHGHRRGGCTKEGEGPTKVQTKKANQEVMGRLGLGYKGRQGGWGWGKVCVCKVCYTYTQ